MARRIDPEAELQTRRPRRERRALGQFFTPEPLARYLAELVMRRSPRTVLDPAVGGGRLLRALPGTVNRFGIDVDPAAIDLARSSLPTSVELVRGDFLDQDAWPLTETGFDAIIANPPYIRQQRLTADQKARRQALNLELDINITSLADYYVYFFCESMRRLNPGGQLVFVTPALFLDASYGTALKQLLMRDGTIEQIVVFGHNRGVFAEARTPAAVTVVTKESSRRHTVFREAEFNGKVDHLTARKVAQRQLAPAASWSRQLPSRVPQAAPRDTVPVAEILRIRRGIATGSNAFFCLTEAERHAAGMPTSYFEPALVSGSGLPERAFTQADWQARLERGNRVWLFVCDTPLERIRSKRVRAYIEHGKAAGIDQRTMCQRSKTLPWYAVENVPAPDYLFTYMSKKPLRFIENQAGVRALTTLLCGWLKPGVDPDWARSVLLAVAASTALTTSAQDLGEGLRKIEPRRLAEVALPAPSR